VAALDGVDLALGPGEILGLLGANGAGKTTLVSIVADLRAPDVGAVQVGGIDAQRDPIVARRLIGIAPQELAVYLQLTVRQNLHFFGRLTGLRGGALERRIDELQLRRAPPPCAVEAVVPALVLLGLAALLAVLGALRFRLSEPKGGKL
jgi:ABC-type multidrug transport system ATPase subunit